MERIGDSIYKLKSNIVLHKNSSSHYWLFNTEDGSHYSINYTSYWILEKIASGRHTFNEILTSFLDTFQVDRETCRNDLQEIISCLENEGIIVRRE